MHAIPCMEYQQCSTLFTSYHILLLFHGQVSFHEHFQGYQLHDLDSNIYKQNFRGDKAIHKNLKPKKLFTTKQKHIQYFNHFLWFPLIGMIVLYWKILRLHYVQVPCKLTLRVAI